MRSRPDELLRDPERLRALKETELLDTDAEPCFDKYTRLAAALLRVSSATITLLEADRGIVKSAFGLLETWPDAGLAPSFCRLMVARGDLFAMPDTARDPNFDREEESLASIRAYAGATLKSEGSVIGALCVFDTAPRHWSSDDLSILEVLADALSSEIALRVTRRKLTSRLQLLDALSNTALDAIISMNAEGIIVFANRAAEQMFGRSTQSLVGHFAAELMPERFRASHARGVARLNAGGEPHLLGRVIELPALRDEAEFPVELSLSRCGGHDQGELVYTAILRDVTERSEMDRALRSAEHQLRVTIERAPIGMALVSPEGRWLSVNDALCALVGYTREELIRSDFQTITHPDDLRADLGLVRQLLAGEVQSYQLEKRYMHRAGHSVWALLSVSLVRDDNGEPAYFISQIQDISERRELERQVREASLRDELTGLQNRRGFMFLAEQQLNTAARYGRDHVLLFADLNGLKTVNDQLGHAEGDRMIVAMAAVLRRTFRRADVLARFGGDEFVLLAEGNETFGPIAERKLQDAIAEHNTALDAFQLSASIGTAVWSAVQRPSLPELLSIADGRMYESKRRHHSRA